MKNVLWYVIFTSALVLGRQEAQKRGGMASRQKESPVTQATTDLAILRLMTATWPILYPKDSKFYLITDACTLDMSKQCDFNNLEDGIPCDFIKTCYVVGMPSDLAIHIFSTTKDGEIPENTDLPPGSKEMAKVWRFHTIFLPFKANLDTYTVLNPAIAPLFFTDDLGGCDMFVATETNKGGKPIVFHTNRNSEPDQVQNLRMKGESVDEILKSYPGYKVVARVYWTSLESDDKAKINKYFEEEYIPWHSEITLLPYNNHDGLPDTGQDFSFIGHYEKQKALWVWKFILKGRTSGTILHEFSVSASGDVINIKSNRVN